MNNTNREVEIKTHFEQYYTNHPIGSKVWKWVGNAQSDFRMDLLKRMSLVDLHAHLGLKISGNFVKSKPEKLIEVTFLTMKGDEGCSEFSEEYQLVRYAEIDMIFGMGGCKINVTSTLTYKRFLMENLVASVTCYLYDILHQESIREAFEKEKHDEYMWERANHAMDHGAHTRSDELVEFSDEELEDAHNRLRGREV